MGRDAERAAHVAARAAQARFAAKLKSISAQASTTRTTGFWVPIVDADPDADFPGNLWLTDDGGRMRSRGTDGTLYDFWSGLRLMSLSTPPAASTGIDVYRDTSDDSLRVRRKDGSWARYPASNPQTGGGTDTTGGSTTTKPKQPDPSPTRHRRVFEATWQRTLCASHGVEETGGDQHYGLFGGSAHGMRRVMIGFNDAAIRSALAGEQIKLVELHAVNSDSWAHSGVELHWGAHNRSAPPGGFSTVRRNVFVGHWPEAGDGTYWRRVPNWYGAAFRDNNIKGLTVDQPAGNAWYGAIRGGSVRLRITSVG